MKRVLITGGTGFIGKSILDYYSRHQSEYVFKVLSRHAGDYIGDVATFEFPEEHFDVIVHLASPLLEDCVDLDIESVILDGTSHVADLAKRDDAVVLFVSSGAVYGRYARPVSEDDECIPTSGYGRGKLASEEYFVSQGVNVKIARCFALTGRHLPRNGGFAIGNFVENALNGAPVVVKGDGTPVRSFLYADDLVEWLFAILERGISGRPYNVGSEEAVSIRDLANMVANVLGGANEVEILGAPICGAADFYVPDVTRARRELGLCVRTNLVDAIRKTAAG